jgi:hypothetical protein
VASKERKATDDDEWTPSKEPKIKQHFFRLSGKNYDIE